MMIRLFVRVKDTVLFERILGGRYIGNYYKINGRLCRLTPFCVLSTIIHNPKSITSHFLSTNGHTSEKIVYHLFLVFYFFCSSVLSLVYWAHP